MKALPVKFYDKNIKKKVQAFESDFDLCCDPEDDSVECVFYNQSKSPCCCTSASLELGLDRICGVIFLEVKE